MQILMDIVEWILKPETKHYDISGADIAFLLRDKERAC